MKFIKKDDDKAAKKRAIAKEERVSLIAKDGKPQPAPSQRKKSTAKGDEWTCSRLMRYMGLTVLSAAITFLVLRKENQVLHWEEVHYLLEPEGTKQQRCYVSISLYLCRRTLAASVCDVDVLYWSVRLLSVLFIWRNVGARTKPQFEFMFC